MPESYTSPGPRKKYTIEWTLIMAILIDAKNPIFFRDVKHPNEKHTKHSLQEGYSL